MRSNAEAVVDLGLRDAGYYYVTTDCGWASQNRTANGTLSFNATLFPSGHGIGDYFHSLGLGFGVYSDAGVAMCNEPGQVPPACSLCQYSMHVDVLISDRGRSRDNRCRYLFGMGCRLAQM